MMLRNPFLQAVILIISAVALAVVTNAFASRERKLVLPGYYPNALKVPPREPQRVPPPPITETAALETAAQSPAPGQPPVAIPTDTIERPAGAPEATSIVPAAGDPRQTAAAGAAPPPTAAPTAVAPAAPPTPQPDPLARFQPTPDKPSVDISGEDAKLLHSRGVLFLDARRTSVYKEGHIAGARSFPVWESDIDEKVMALYEERSDPREQNLPIVIYCSGGACEDSHMLAQKLWGIQFNNIYVYKDGFPDWQQRGGPVRTGERP